MLSIITPLQLIGTLKCSIIINITMGHERELPSVDSYITTTLRLTCVYTGQNYIIQAKLSKTAKQSRSGLCFALLHTH